MKSLSRVRLLATPWTAAYQAPPSVVFSGQQYWSGVPLMLQKAGLWIHATGDIMLPVMLHVVYFTTAVWGKLVFSHGNREDTGSFRKKCWHKYPVFKNNWLIYSSNKASVERLLYVRPWLQKCMSSGRGKRRHIMQWVLFEPTQPSSPYSSFQKETLGHSRSTSGDHSSFSCWAFDHFFSILVPPNHWYSTLSSMFHPFLPFVMDGRTLFLSPDFW